MSARRPSLTTSRMDKSIRMMRGEGHAHLGQTLAETGGLFDCDAFSPRDQVPAHLVEAAGLEPHGQGFVLVLDGGLVRMEEERPGVRCRHGVEAQDDVQGFFLEDAERTLGIGSEIEILVAGERLFGHFRFAHVGETPEPHVVAASGSAHQERAVPVEQAVRLNAPQTAPARGLCAIPERDHATGLEGLAQGRQQTFCQLGSWSRAHGQTLGLHERLPIGFKRA